MSNFIVYCVEDVHGDTFGTQFSNSVQLKILAVWFLYAFAYIYGLGLAHELLYKVGNSYEKQCHENHDNYTMQQQYGEKKSMSTGANKKLLSDQKIKSVQSVSFSGLQS